ncbi:MAG: hypothetical protein RMN24_00735 [Anaerolineae bacterium]|nr:hypothetical protein [Caldilineales bacterium]MDW8267665.1 hypothetical protein [Anaerolineae bacterium]
MRKRGDIILDGKPYRLVEGRAAESVSFATPFAPKQVQGDYQLSDFEAYSITAQTQFNGGMGRLRFERPTEYLWGYRVDARGERATLGPKPDSMQPDSADAYGGLGELHINGSDLNVALMSDTPVNWFTLDAAAPRIAVRFRTPVAGGSTSFSPSQLPGLKLWLRADAGTFQDTAGTIPAVNNNDPVALWQDQSGNGNHFSISVAGQRPLLKTNVQNGLPAIQGDGSNDQLTGNAPVLGGNTRTIFVVVRAETNTAEDVWFDLGNRAAGGGRGMSVGNLFLSGGKFGVRNQNGNRFWTATASPTAYSIVTVRLNGSDTPDLEAWINGAALTVHSTNTQVFNTVGPAYLFRDSTTTPGYSSCAIGELIVYEGALTETDRAAVEGYLASRWNITVSSPTTGQLIVQRMWAYVRSRTGITTSTLNYAIFTDSAGNPGTAVTNGTTANATREMLTYDGRWVDLVCPTAMSSLAGDTNYWLVIQFTPAGAESVEVAIVPTASATGVVKWHDGTTWTTLSQTVLVATAQYLPLAPDTPPRKFVEFNRTLYALAGRRLYSIRGPTALTMVNRVFAGDLQDALVVRRASDTAPRLLVAPYEQPMEVFDGTNWTVVTGQTADRLALHDNLFWRAAHDATNGVYVQGTSNYNDWATSGTAGTRITVGDSRYLIKQLFSWRGNLYAGKEDGLYVITYGDTYPAAGVQGQANKVLDLSGEVNPNNFEAAALFQNDLYFSIANGLARYSANDVISSATPDASLLRQEQKRGRFTALVGTLAHMYACYERDISEASQLLVLTTTGWHGLATTDRRGDPMRAIAVDTGLYSILPRVWYTSHAVITSFPEPTWSGRRWTFATDASDSPVSFFLRSGTNPGGILYTSWIDANLINIVKDWIDLDIVGTFPTGTSVEVQYRYEEGASFVTLGTVNTSPATLTFPAGTTSTRIQLAFVLRTTAPYRTPQLWGYALRYVHRPRPKLYFTLQLILADYIDLHTGQDTRTAAEQWADIIAARNASEAIALTLSDGSTYNVHVDQITRQMVDVVQVNEAIYKRAYICVVGLREA